MPHTGDKAAQLQTDQESLTMQLLRTREALMRHFRPMLSARDVSETQWRVLRSLYERPAIEAAKLAHYAAVMAPSLTRMLRTLDERGLIVMERHPSDGRRLIISLSESGFAFMAEALPEMERIYRHLAGVIEANRMTEVLSLLKDIAHRAGTAGILD